MAQFQGLVRWFNNKKGYGFLGREGSPDVFVHYSAIMDDGYQTLREGEQVEYDVIQGQGGPQADHVRRLGRPSALHDKLPSLGPVPLTKPNVGDD